MKNLFCAFPLFILMLAYIPAHAQQGDTASTKKHSLHVTAHAGGVALDTRFAGITFGLGAKTQSKNHPFGLQFEVGYLKMQDFIRLRDCNMLATNLLLTAATQRAKKINYHAGAGASLFVGDTRALSSQRHVALFPKMEAGIGAREVLFKLGFHPYAGLYTLSITATFGKNKKGKAKFARTIYP
jgi:hypothetical protein